MSSTADRVVGDFITRYESAWAKGGEAVAQLYTADGVLIGHVTAIGRSDIARALGTIIGQGWTQIKVSPVNIRNNGNVILVASEYTAIGSGANAGKTLSATSSYVLVQADGEWLATLHTAR